MKNLLKNSLLFLGLIVSSSVMAQSACNVSYVPLAFWGSGGQQSVTITNNGPATAAWELNWTFKSNEKINNLWNGAVTQTGNSVSVKNAYYNGVIPSGGNVNIGYLFDGADGGIPASFTLNGKLCTGGSGSIDSPYTATWLLNKPTSAVYFITVKNTNNAENQTFSNIDATIDKNGVATLAIDLASVSTNIDIRNERLRNILFETGLLPTLYFSAPLDTAAMSALGVGQSQLMTLAGNLSLHGVSKALTAQVLVTRTDANNLQVVSAKPILINSVDFDLNAGIEALRAVANLTNIGEMVPVYLRLHLVANTDKTKMVIAVPGTPTAPTIAQKFTDATREYSLSWPDSSDKETGYIVRSLINGRWTSRDSLAANSTSFAEVLLNAGDYSYKVIAINNSIPSASSNVATITLGAPPIDDGITGETHYKNQCASCHGVNGDGGVVKVPLNVAKDIPTMTAYITANMPLGNPTACDAKCAEKVMAYIKATFWTVSDTEVPALRQLSLLSRYEYNNTVNDLLGVNANVVGNFPVEVKINGFDNNSEKNLVTNRHVDEYLVAAESLATQALATNRAQIIPCPSSQTGCSTQFINSFGLKAFRRPLTSVETAAYQALFATETNFDEGAKLVIRAMLVSPNFLYKSAMGTLVDGKYVLTPYEVATQLSYMFWGTMPDSSLLDAAAANQLSTKGQIEVQARRLLANAKAKSHLGHFAAQWLEADRDDIGGKSATVYPGFTPAVRDAMDKEMRNFFNYVVFDSTKSFNELFTANYVFVNSDLANYYKIANVTGTDFRQVVDGSGLRGGVLTLGAVMAAHGHSNETAPIPRGKFVRKRILCQDMPPPPTDLNTSFPDPDPSLTTRERFTLRTAAPECQLCHKYLNGVGFGFENFDGAGAYRTLDNSKIVNSTGVILGLESLAGTDTTAYNGAKEMEQVIANSASAKACFAKQYYRFSRGYAETTSDTATLKNLTQKFADSSYNLQELMVGVTQQNSFTLRRAQ